MALPSTGILECNGTGNDANGGGYDPANSNAGIDLTYGPGATFYSYADLVTTNGTSSTPTITSASRPFVSGTSGDGGNYINITGGGTFIAGRYQVTPNGAGGATLDRACATTASTSGGTGRLGGALLTLGPAASVMVGGNALYIAAGTYLITTATSNISGGRMTLPAGVSAAFPTRVIGYGTVRGDAPAYGARPVYSSDGVVGGAAASFVTATNANIIIEYLSLTNVLFGNSGSWSGINGTTTTTVRDCDFFSFNQSGRFAVTAGNIERVRVERCRIGAQLSVRSFVSQSIFIDCSTHINTANSQIKSVVIGCIFVTLNQFFGSSDGACTVIGATDSTVEYYHCTLYGAYFALAASTTAFGGRVHACVQSNSPTYGVISNLVSALPNLRFTDCAFGLNTSGNFSGVLPTTGTLQMMVSPIILTVSPLANAAGGDYSLNSTAGGGDACRSASIFTWPGTATSNTADIGAVQMGVRSADIALIAAAILSNSANKLATDSNGAVVSSSVTGNVGGNVSGSVGSVAGNVSGSVASIVGNVGGNVVGSVASVTGNVGGNVSGNVNGSVASVAGNVSGSVASVAGAVGSVTGNVGGNLVGNVNGNVVGSTGSVTGAVGSVTGNVGGNVLGGIVGNVLGSVASVVGNIGGSVNSVVSGVALSSGERTTLAGVIWNSLLTVATVPLSFGARLVAFFAALGTDNRVKISEDIHNSGVTVAGVADIDVPTPAEIAAAVAGELGVIPVTFQIRDSGGDPLEGARIVVQNTCICFSGTNGNVTIALNPGSYTVLVSPMEGIAFPSTAITVPASGSLTTTITGSVPAPPTPPDDPTLCRVYIYIAQPSGSETASYTIKRLPQKTTGGAYKVGTTRTADVVTTEGSNIGTISFNVPQQSEIEVNCVPSGINQRRVQIGDDTTLVL